MRKEVESPALQQLDRAECKCTGAFVLQKDIIVTNAFDST